MARPSAPSAASAAGRRRRGGVVATALLPSPGTGLLIFSGRWELGFNQFKVAIMATKQPTPTRAAPHLSRKIKASLTTPATSASTPGLIINPPDKAAWTDALS